MVDPASSPDWSSIHHLGMAAVPSVATYHPYDRWTPLYAALLTRLLWPAWSCKSRSRQQPHHHQNHDY